ncbi:signal peptidase I [Clostridium senegalense]|uniref:signal peptidase I n=2 Tax=Clostridium senegalense TaxID=1465809 RepID=UPI001C123DFF|nr:signal peptidase I [Clostridium senegalense]MBU5226312.1 signal peptidase I [Clostridium senegalense]
MKKFIKDWLWIIIVALIIAGVTNKFIFFNIKVTTGSMLPTIQLDDTIFCTKIYGEKSIKRGEIIVFESKELKDDLVKRVIGLPNDHVEFKNDGTVYINNKKLEEPYVVNNSDKTGIFDVPEHCYLFAGDNRATSLDARSWDNPYINYKDIKGRAKFVIMPFSRWGKLDK